MLDKATIAISPLDTIATESEMINRLFDAGLFRYHIKKKNATEQSIAEILEGVAPKYLNQITLHSHFHLVLAYGVGGIHYSLAHRSALGDDFTSKVNLYQGFGVKVSTDVGQSAWAPADYAMSVDEDLTQNVAGTIFIKSKIVTPSPNKFSALVLQDILATHSLEEVLSAINTNSTKV